MNTEPTKKDYLAHTIIGAGGSWARGEDLEATIARCAKLTKLDWGKMYDLDGVTIKIGVADVTGHDRVSMGDRGVWAGNTNIPYLEIREVTLPGKKKKAKKTA